MPIYQYGCANGHKHDHIHYFSSGERPAALPCPASGCGLDARYEFAPPAPTMGCKPEAKAIELKPDVGFTNHLFRCTSPDCGHAFEDLNDWSAGQKPDDARECPECKGEAKVLHTLNIAAWSVKQFCAAGGYYDRGLGMWINSKGHREQVMKERNLVAYDDEGDGWLDREFSKRDAELAKEEAALADYDDRLQNAPGFAPLRRAMDQGLV